MELIEEILSQNNLKEAIRRVKINKGAPGIDKRTIDEPDSYFKEHQTNQRLDFENEISSARCRKGLYP